MGDVNVTVLGAGVIGLTTALLLSRNPKYSVTVVAKHMPGDYDIEYASPWAGANYLPVSKEGTPFQAYERDTWAPLSDLATNHPEAGIHFQDAITYLRAKDVNTPIYLWQKELLRPDPWYATVVPNFHQPARSTLPPGIDSANAFTSVCINTALYLPWLASRCLAAGVTLHRGVATHITEAASLSRTSRASIVVNCTGLGARSLGGVQDTTVVPARGQIVVVRNDPGIMAGVSGTDDGDDECVYLMHRAAGGGCVIGGCYQKGNWEAAPDMALAERIMRRAVEQFPALTKGKGVEALSVVRHGVGLRPVREGGPRVEREWVEGGDGGVWVVHNYGHGGAGYQSSWGSAQAAVGLVDAIVEGREKASL